MKSFDEPRVRQLLADDAFARGLGVEIVSVESDEIVLSLKVTPAHTNFLGLGHGGMVFSLADCALSLASNSSGDTALAVDAHIALTAPSRPGNVLTAHVRPISVGQSLATYDVLVARDEGRVVATFTGTVHIATS